LGGKFRPLYIDEISSRLHVAAKFDEISSLRAFQGRLQFASGSWNFPRDFLNSKMRAI